MDEVSSLGEGQLLTFNTLIWTGLTFRMVQSVALHFVSIATQTDPLDLKVSDAEIPSLPSQPREEGFHVVCLEFINSTINHSGGINQGVVWEGLAKFPEPYEILPTGLIWDDDECADRGDEEPKTPEAFPGTSEVGTLNKTPVVSVPDKNPSCPH